VDTTNYSLHKRRVPVGVVTKIESDSSRQGDMTEMTPILLSVHKSNDSFQRRRVQLSVLIIIEYDCRVRDDMTELTPILNSVHK
jgi:hypothetical protein